MKHILLPASIVTIFILVGSFLGNPTHKTIELELPSLSQKQIDQPYQKVRVFHISTDREVNMESDIGCMTSNVYFEGANQIDLGKVGIAFVTKKRSKMWGNKTICDAVKKTNYDVYGMIKTNQCHYSWNCDGDPVKFVNDDTKSNEAWYYSWKLSESVINGKVKDPTKGADHYCTLKAEKLWLTEKKGGAWWIDYMKPESRVVIGDHVFYTHDPKKFEERTKKQKGLTT